jgi:perosamine synthetase
MIQHSSISISKSDFLAVNSVLKSGMLASGPNCSLFKEKLSLYFGSKNVFLTNSGSSAIYLALKTLNTNKKEIILPTYVCKDVLESILFAGFKPVLCDIEESWNISIKTVKNKITKNTAAIIVPHSLGISVNVNELKKTGVTIIEDCCQSFGAYYNGNLVGTMGDISVLSFQATKCLSTGEGGAVIVNVQKKTNLKELKKLEHIFRMSDLQAALGISQLNQYKSFLKKRIKIADLYFKSIDPILTNEFLKCRSQSMFFRFLLCTENNFEKTQAHFKSKGIAVRRGIDSLLHRDYNLGKDKEFKNSVNYFNKTISIPIYPNLKTTDVKIISNAINNYFNEG